MDSPTFLLDLDQGSYDWEIARLGKATASNFHRIITPAKGEYAAGARKYAREVASGRMFQENSERSIGHLPAVERGKVMEADAVAAYHVGMKKQPEKYGVITDGVGLVISANGLWACSPDRVSTNRLLGVEIKCPGGPAWLEAKEKIDAQSEKPDEEFVKYKWQVVGSMLVSQFETWDLWVYHPGVNPIHVRYERVNYQGEIDKLERALLRFEEDVQYYCVMIRENGWEEPIGGTRHASVKEFDKLLAADSGAWALG